MSDKPLPESGQEKEEAIVSYQKLLEHDPTSQVFALVAEHLCAKGLWQEAEAICRRGLLFHPHYLKGKVLLGWALRELGETDEAEHILTEAHKELGKSAMLYEILADIAEGKGEHDLAQHYLTVYEHLQASPEPIAAAEPQAQEAPFAAEPPKPKLLEFLGHLSARYEQKSPGTHDPSTILTEEDRQQLHQMFNMFNLSTG